MRQLLLGVIWLAAVLAAFAGAGRFHATILGILVGATLYFANRLLTQWRTAAARERRLIAVAFVAAAVGTALGFSILIGDARYYARKSRELQAEIHADPRFSEVTAHYSGLRDLMELHLGGHVASQQDYAALQSMAEENFWGFKCDVRWHGAVVTEGT